MNKYEELLPRGQKFPDTSKSTVPEQTQSKLATVSQLKEFIADLPDDATIELEGCDCMGDCTSFTYDGETNELQMWRY